MNRLLFLNKARTQSWDHGTDYSCGHKSSGLYNSVRFVVGMLNANGIEAHMEEVIDNNCIDRMVNKYKPTHVIIEALWVVPEKFDVLKKLHPNVTWIIRLHSEIPFIASEGITFDWIAKYLDRGLTIAINSQRFYNDAKKLYKDNIIYLPNFYDVDMYNNLEMKSTLDKQEFELHIGCFGAIRPLKNQLIQAVAAIEYANEHDKVLKFHINGGRIEDNASSTLKNIRELFKTFDGHELVEHDWMPHEVFVALLNEIDLLMQVSFSETYNIVAADAVSVRTPVVSSEEILFIAPVFQSNTTYTSDIRNKIGRALKYKKLGTAWNRCLLEADATRAAKIWIRRFGEE